MNHDQVGVIVRYPGQSRVKGVEQRASGVDIFASVLDALRLSPPTGLHGRRVRNPPADGATAIEAESYAPGVVLDFHPRFPRTERALFPGEWKLIDSRPIEIARLARIDAPGAQSSTKPVPADPATLERLEGLGYLK